MVFILLLILPAIIRAELLRIDQGLLNGTTLKSRNGHEFHAFYGIPFAQPPTGSLRFQPPKLPPPTWNETRNAFRKPISCPQMTTRFKESFFGSEDCLFLNVFTRNTQPEKLAPVLVFIYGGGFVGGGSDLYNPEFLMDKSMVLVTVNYRVGVFGFFSTGDPSFPGNYGLKDQVAALQWIQKNIWFFGGDPNAVTIMGHSAGSASVQLHTFSPSSKDLFHRAIHQSAVSTNGRWGYYTAEEAKVNFDEFREHANCSRSSTKESVDCLLALPAEILKGFDFTFPHLNAKSPYTAFLPVIEPMLEGAFLVTDPNEFACPEPIKPSIFGFTSNEALGFPERLYKDLFPANLTNEDEFNDILPKKLHYQSPDNPELEKNITALIKELYFGNNLSNINNETSKSLLISEVLFTNDVIESIRKYPGVRYTYVYDYNDSSASKDKPKGVGHGQELKRLFLFEPNVPESDSDKEVSEVMITYWSNFVSSGDPNIPDKKLPTQWTPFKSGQNKTEEYFMHISNNGFHMKRGLSSDLHDKLWAYIRESRAKKVRAN